MVVEELESWLAAAEADLQAALVLGRQAHIPASITSFHFQQAAEKALKGLLVVRGEAPPHIHDLRVLVSRLALQPPLSADVAGELTPFAVLARYPGFSALPDPETVERFLRFAEACVARLRTETAVARSKG